MAQIVECVPNFSEGRRPEILDKIIEAALTIDGVTLLDREMDADHNRAVVTFIGEPQSVKKAAYLAIEKAANLIDMEKHSGEHPRMGATDVCPFVPVSGVSMADCVLLAEELGAEVGSKLQIPVFLYEKAARRPDRENLADVRKGEYEGIKATIESDDSRIPDFGPRKVHPSAGAIAIGARPFLVAYNVYLGSNNLTIAKKIAEAVRFKTGGFMFCKALGFEIKERNQVQVSMNLVDHTKTPIFRVFETIKNEAERYGVGVTSSEIVGLTPLKAMADVADHYLRLENFDVGQILEYKLLSQSTPDKISLDDFLTEVASSSPAPGGGSVSALAASLAGALSSMVCRLTIGKKKYVEVKDELSALLVKTEDLRNRASALIVKDAEAFNQLMSARKLPKNSVEEISKRNDAIAEATRKAALVPLETMSLSVEILKFAKIVAEKGNVNSVSDAGVAGLLAKAALDGAAYNVKINLIGFEDTNFVSKTNAKLGALHKEAEPLAKHISDIVNLKING
ncbi:MAG: glutamate formimidoyltransferase [candidate division Zixibacteria bacterium CG_4_9_14_3_um_filter_46_8]|nr:MAG: glutamate formimidoyltransferase [candidate division Zixibacteria bacterium CG_4_9_14_3_um_filter_46_8]